MIRKPSLRPCIALETAISSICPIVPTERTNFRSRMMEPQPTIYERVSRCVQTKEVYKLYLWTAGR